MKQQLNLNRRLPRKIKNPLPLKVIALYWAGLILLLILPSTYVIWHYRGKKAILDDVQAKKQALTQRIITLKQKHPGLGGEPQEQLSQAQQRQKSKILQMQGQSSFQYSKFFRNLAQFIPSRVWLTNIVIEKGDTTIMLKGKALSYIDVTRMIRSLNRSSVFARRSFQLISIKHTNQGRVNFQLRTK